LSNCNCVLSRFSALFNNFLGNRDTLLEAGIRLFSGHPFVGAGLGSFVGLVPPYQYPHNVPLEIAGEMGLLGVIVLLGPLAFGWVRLFIRGVSQGSAATASLLAIVLTFLVVANFSGDLPAARPLWIFSLVALKFSISRAPVAVPAANVIGEDRQPVISA
jgi:O-antigen ligase